MDTLKFAPPAPSAMIAALPLAAETAVPIGAVGAAVLLLSLAAVVGWVAYLVR